MDNKETFKERLLQDEALQRRLDHEHDIIMGITVLMSHRARRRQKEEKKEGKTERKTAVK